MVELFNESYFSGSYLCVWNYIPQHLCNTLWHKLFKTDMWHVCLFGVPFVPLEAVGCFITFCTWTYKLGERERERESMRKRIVCVCVCVCVCASSELFITVTVCVCSILLFGGYVMCGDDLYIHAFHRFNQNKCLTLSDLTIRKQHCLLDSRHSCSALPGTAHPRSWTAAAGGTNINGSLFSNYGINLHHSFYDRKTINSL